MDSGPSATNDIHKQQQQLNPVSEQVISSSSEQYTVLQKHVMFFDFNKDGIIYPLETYRGLCAIGAGTFLSAIVSVIIHLGFSSLTRPGKFPSLRFPIEIKNIKRAKHGSDSDVYDSEGRFVLEKFDEIFTTYAKTHQNALTSKELDEMMKRNREPKDYLGWMAGYVEWKVTFHLAKDKNELLQKETVRSLYDGSLFERLAKERQMQTSKKPC
ncbi:Probable peroxygenase 4 [Linum perenne]